MSHDEIPAVRADEALLDALGGRVGFRPELEDDELAALLLQWRREIDALPMREPEGDGLGVFRGIAVGLLLTAVALLVVLGWWAS